MPVNFRVTTDELKYQINNSFEEISKFLRATLKRNVVKKGGYLGF